MHITRVKFKDIEEVPRLQINTNFKQDFTGSAPAPFIGRVGYPHVNIGILSPQFSGEVSSYDSPKLWSKEHFQIGEVAAKRYSLVNSRMKWNIKKQGTFLDLVQETAMAKTAAEVEIHLTKMPTLELRPEKEIIPFGPGSEIKMARITSNTKVNQHIEKVVADTDLKAAEGILELYQKGLEENALSKVLSVGAMGLKNNRKLVPTRWSITATDDTIGKQLIQEIKQLPVGEYQAYFGGEWGNYYLLLFLPEVWSFELFETYLKESVNPWSKNGYMYSTDYEGHEGRKKYAEETAGGYYACRVPVLEKMKALKRQHACLALRFITSEYNVPLGVWVCREATRKSTEEKNITFASEELLLQYARSFIKSKFGFDLDLLLKESKLLRNKKEQKKLSEF